MMQRHAVFARISQLPYFIRFVCAALVGAGGAWALPPDANPAALVLYHAGILLLLETARHKRAGFGLGWAGGFGFHFIGLAWVGEAFLVDAAQFGWMRPFAMAGLPALLALFPGLACGLWIYFARRPAPVRIALYAALFMGAEWLRGNILTGFPWNLPIQAWDRYLGVLQAVSYIGPYGVSLLTVLAACSMAAIVLTDRRTASVTIGLCSLPLAVTAILGSWVLAEAPAVSPTVPGIKLRLVQPNVPQTEKWLPELRSAHFNQLFALSADAGSRGVTHIIWPEAATPFLLLESQTALDAIASIVPKNGALITGTPRRSESSGSSATYNSIAVIDGKGTATAIYDKRHLVPFGEYVPLRNWIPADRLAPGRGNFVAGHDAGMLAVPGAPDVRPLICYEAIFPGLADSVHSPGSWLLNATNDAWFGASAGPSQHLSIVRLRAIERRMSMIRVANTGISAVIDPYGRIIAKIKLNTVGTLDTPLPQNFSRQSIFSKFGNAFFFVVMSAVAAAACLFRGRSPIKYLLQLRLVNILIYTLDLCLSFSARRWHTKVLEIVNR